jgi:hypothetical protein
MSSEGVVACNFHGKTLAIDISDLVGWHFQMLRGFHPEVVETIVRFADRHAEEVFWDIGANKERAPIRSRTLCPSARSSPLSRRTS